MSRSKALLRSGPAALAAGLMVLGASSYGFLLLCGQVLGDENYAPLGTVWLVVFLFAPAFFFPVEQEVGRAVAARRARGDGIAPLVKRAAFMTLVLAATLVAVAVLLSPAYINELLNGEPALVFAFVVAIVGFALEYLLKGVLAGSGRLRAYGFLIAVEGIARFFGAVGVAVAGSDDAASFALVIGLACFVAIIATLPGKRVLVTPGSSADWRELSTSLGNLITASLLSQFLINAAPLVVKYAATASQQVLAGAFIKAVVITRIPLFLFQAVQAVLLPRLTSSFTVGDHDSYRKTLRLALELVALVGLIGVIGATILGDELLRMFGSNYDFSRSDMALLAAGNAVFLLCMTVAQALVAVKSQGRTVIGWACGVLAFGVSYALPGDIVTRSIYALLLGATAALLALCLLLRQRLSQVKANSETLVDALAPNHEIVEL